MRPKRPKVFWGKEMHSVITEKQARQITGGRKPLVPIEYEAAVNALQACVTLDEAKYWSDKSDALAAWAKIYRDGQVEREARQLKLHAYRRMGELARELSPVGLSGGRPTKKSGGGPSQLLMGQGLTMGAARAAIAIAVVPEKKFDEAVKSVRPPSPYVLIKKSSGSEAWTIISANTDDSLSRFRTFCRKYSNPAELARGLTPDEVSKSKAMAVECMEWLDAFEHALPNQKK